MIWCVLVMELGTSSSGTCGGGTQRGDDTMEMRCQCICWSKVSKISLLSTGPPFQNLHLWSERHWRTGPRSLAMTMTCHSFQNSCALPSSNCAVSIHKL
jgi:hypothetical protein